MASKYKSNKLNISQWLQLGVVLLVAVGLVVTVQAVRQKTSLSSFADIPQTNAVLSFSPPVPDNPLTVGSTFTTNILVNTGGQSILAIDTIVHFDPTKLQAVSVDPTYASQFTSYPAKHFNNNKGTVNVSANIGTGQATGVTSAALNLATVTFQVISPITSTYLTYEFTPGNRNDSNVITEETDRRKGATDILGSVQSLFLTTEGVAPSPSPSTSPAPSLSPAPSSSPDPSAVPSPSPSSSPIGVTFKIELQGKSGETLRSELPVQLSSAHLNEQGTTGTVQTTSAILSTASDFTVSLLPGRYVVRVKVPSYLARRYGSLTSPIDIMPASPVVDVTLDPLFGGDFNNDGIINEIDYTAFFLTNFGSNDINTDLDNSGQVNNLDYAIMRSNWGLSDDTI